MRPPRLRTPTLFLALIVATSPAFADDGLAARSTRGVTFGIAVEGEVAGPIGTPGVVPCGGVSVRLSLSGLLLSAGFHIWPNFISINPRAEPTVEPQLGVGYRFVLSRRVALSPTARTGWWHSFALGKAAGAVFGVELPVSVFLSRHFFLEPFVFGGVYQAYAIGPLASAGLRLGWLF